MPATPVTGMPTNGSKVVEEQPRRRRGLRRQFGEGSECRRGHPHRPRTVRWSCRVILDGPVATSTSTATSAFRSGAPEVLRLTAVSSGSRATRRPSSRSTSRPRSASPASRSRAGAGDAHREPARRGCRRVLATLPRLHPLTRRPSRGGRRWPDPHGCQARSAARGVGVALPFELPLPVDAAPTARAVHSSMRWFVQARMFYAGFTGPLTERVVHRSSSSTTPDALLLENPQVVEGAATDGRSARTDRACAGATIHGSPRVACC